MPFEIEYKLSGNDPHLYRLPHSFLRCEEALGELASFLESLDKNAKGIGAEFKIVWID
jgi:hypothetical protein